MQPLSFLVVLNLSCIFLILVGWLFQFSENSFISQEQALQSFQTAVLEAETNAIDALKHFYESFCLYETYESVLYAYWLASQLGIVSLEVQHQQFCLRSSIIDVKDIIDKDNTLVVEVVNFGNDYEATQFIISNLLIKYPCHFDALFHAGVHAIRYNRIDQAISMYERALACNSIHTKSLLNLATIYQSFGEYDIAIDLYHKGIALESPFQSVLSNHLFVSGEYISMRNNLPLAYFQRGALSEAVTSAIVLTKYLSSIIDMAQQQEGVDSTKVYYALMGSYGNFLIICRAALVWQNWEYLHHHVLNFTIWKGSIVDNEEDNNYPGPLLPFESLMIDIPLSTRLLLAQSASTIASKAVVSVNNSITINAKNDKLIIGFFSCDFGDHPTSHLLLGLFANIHRLRQQRPWYQHIYLHIYSFGKMNDSPYQQHFRQWADRYYDMMEWSQQQIIHRFQSDQVDLLLEMQLHTLGNRLDITSLHPVPSIVNYLVYPGTSGATFMDYIFCDPIVVPPEQARFYSEKLMYVPATYQISSYEYFGLQQIDSLLENINSLEQLLTAQRLLRKELSLPQDAMIFVNFNKIDKIEPKTMTVWMNIMRRFPSAFLWLLLPSESPNNSNNDSRSSSYSSRREVLQHNLYQYAALFGIHKMRIIIAEKTFKPEHIRRHLAADAFLDTLIYGAHSTATDALRGALPILAMTGESFPSRVITSLYASFASEDRHIAQKFSLMMTTDSVKGFEDQAARLAAAPIVLQKMKLMLIELIRRQAGLFNATRHDVKMLTAMAAIKESKESRLFQHREQRWNLIQLPTT